MTVERMLRMAIVDIESVLEDLPRKLSTLHGCQPGPGQPDGRYIGPDGSSSLRDPSDKRSSPVKDHDDFYAAVAKVCDSARRATLINDYPGVVVAKPPKRNSTVDPDACTSCARDHRSEFPWFTAAEDAGLCRWCYDIRATWGKLPTVRLVIEHHKRGEVGGRIPSALFEQEMGPVPAKVASYTGRLAREAAAMTTTEGDVA